ncbi:MAG: tetratricopeptide repeat protein [Bacteroidaceae bacterium]|nr:tetratricopeptide repeat protein [Bacteroidaceae bacterium]
MKRILLAISLFLCAGQLFAQSGFTQANNAYSQGNYAEAISGYEQLISEAQAREALTDDYAEVYYNLGNAYYKQGELGQSILAYERALRLKPRMKDAKQNLQFVEQRITDRIDDTRSFFLQDWLIALRNQWKESTWTWLSIVLFTIMLAGLLLFLLGREATVRKIAFHCAWISLLLSLYTGINAGTLHSRDTYREEAIIMQGVVNAKSSPDRSGTDLFQLHEGTKVRITDTLGDWSEVRVAQWEGWIETRMLERI